MKLKIRIKNNEYIELNASSKSIRRLKTLTKLKTKDELTKFIEHYIRSESVSLYKNVYFRNLNQFKKKITTDAESFIKSLSYDIAVIRLLCSDMTLTLFNRYCNILDRKHLKKYV